ncbi:hypothetical protein C4D60_Mb04t38630 [Musa balbisiana]|uniref:Uncharacterized protein n=1 Tax=Musa balbisiana TaxID=52838 RepID=A0A4V4HAC0_MUSBA|nr:hypothetical protein C4D60_Mb04t38630 [Musa balbisiana]
MTGSHHIMLTSSPTTSLLLEVLPERKVQSPVSATKLSSSRPFNGANKKDCKVFLWRCHPKGKPKSSFCHKLSSRRPSNGANKKNRKSSFGGVTQKKSPSPVSATKLISRRPFNGASKKGTDERHDHRSSNEEKGGNNMNLKTMDANSIKNNC